jgi:TolB-like protein
MSRTRICVFLLLVSAAALSAQTKPRLAILPFTGGTGGDGETIAELFSYEEELRRVFTVVSRTSTIEAIMREQQFQRSSGLTDSDTIARLGRQYNADYVMAGHIQTLGARRLVLITIIHVESLRQIAGDYREYGAIEEVQVMIPDMAKRIVAASRINAASLPHLAVLPFAVPAGVDQADAEMLAQLLAVEIANSGKYAVLPRTTTIQAVMTEHAIQRSGLTEADNIKVIGKALNAQYVLAGSVRSLGRTNMFTASIDNIETAERITGDHVNYRAMDDGLKLMAELGAKLTGTASTVKPGPPRESSRLPAPSLPPIQLEALPALGIAASAFFGGGTAGWDLMTAGLHVGINLRSSNGFFLNILGDAGAGLGIGVGSYYCGGSVEILLLKRFLFGAGGGMTGAVDSSSGDKIIPFSPYVRGSLAFNLLPDDFDQMSIKAFYDHIFDHGFRLGLTFNIFLFLDD